MNLAHVSLSASGNSTPRIGPLLWAPGAAAVVWSLGKLLGLSSDAAITAGLTVWCAAWWVAEPVPISVTGLVPLAALPLTGVLPEKEAAQAYGHPLILLLLGGLLISSALERSQAHRRLAMYMLRIVGGHSLPRLVLGFMLASAVLSMWISNTATTLMLLPVAFAVIEQDKTQQLGLPLLLGIAYAASIGGLGTPIGTPPNLLFLANYEQVTGQSYGFTRWMSIGVPAACLLLPIAFAVLVRGLPKGEPLHIPEQGPWRAKEVRVVAVFALTALAWITRAEPFGGWSEWFGVPTAGDSSVALASAVVLFVVPSGERDEQGRVVRLLDWDTARKVPWGLLLLFSGGMALAKAFQASGLSQTLGEQLSALANAPLLLLMLVLCLAVSFLTEVTSNTATSAVLMPVLSAAAMNAGLRIELLMVPAVLSASCAFMLPVATAPNAIVFSSGRISGRRMARMGVTINLLGAAAIAVVCYVLL